MATEIVLSTLVAFLAGALVVLYILSLRAHDRALDKYKALADSAFLHLKGTSAADVARAETHKLEMEEAVREHRLAFDTEAELYKSALKNKLSGQEQKHERQVIKEASTGHLIEMVDTAQEDI